LNAGEDRLALSCLMTIDEKGVILDSEIAESVINVSKRMSYVNVQKLLNLHLESASGKAPEGDDLALWQEHEDLIDDFVMMEKLSKLLRARRYERGGIDFDLPECKIELDETGRPTWIGPYDRNEATKIIEDFMLAANETVAEHFYWMEIPFVYRVHGAPEEKKLRVLHDMLSNMGYSFKTTDRKGKVVGSGELHPKEYQKLLAKIEGLPEEAMISRMVLRSMQQAKYSDHCDGHFGLACKYYCHFTSPIRRYPDLQIHRILKENLHGLLDEKRIKHYENLLPGVAADNSAKERRADDAERDVDKLKQIEYMEDHLGEEFDGILSGFNTQAIFVELPNTIEGVIPLGSLSDDFYEYHEETFQMIGNRTKKTYNLGDPAHIQVVRTDKAERRIEFRFVEAE